MGYLLIDSRESGGKLEEYDTRGCKHCGGAVKVYRPPYTHACGQECQRYGCDHIQGYCWRCDGALCRHCCAVAQRVNGCVIYRREMEQVLAAYHRRRNLERLFGI